MVAERRLYDLLGVEPDADVETMKKAFKDRAKELHPDKNPDPDATRKFQELNAAWEILRDPAKRKAYDRNGVDDHGEAREDRDGRFRERERVRKRTKNIDVTVQATLEQLYQGSTADFKYQRKVICRDCEGAGVAPGKRRRPCATCEGRGEVAYAERFGPFTLPGWRRCKACQGEGTVVGASDACKRCHGSGVLSDNRTERVHFEPGMEDGEKIRFSGAANEGPGRDPGDVVVTIKEKQHRCFQRRHDDLLITKEISLADALLGRKFEIEHLDGHRLLVSPNTDGVLRPRSVKVIRGWGMPVRGNITVKGSLFVVISIAVPNTSYIPPAVREAVIAHAPGADLSKLDPNKVRYAKIVDRRLPAADDIR